MCPWLFSTHTVIWMPNVIVSNFPFPIHYYYFLLIYLMKFINCFSFYQLNDWQSLVSPSEAHWELQQLEERREAQEDGGVQQIDIQYNVHCWNKKINMSFVKMKRRNYMEEKIYLLLVPLQTQQQSCKIILLFSRSHSAVVVLAWLMTFGLR